MKNIHVLPTDKPSRLFINPLWESQLRFVTDRFVTKKYKERLPQHIYVTSDEEIKKGDWCLYNKNHNSRNPNWELVKCGVIEREEMHPISDGRLLLWMVKIILTTDQDLIAERVQEIPDDFLEWFVKNPTCEYAQVKGFFKACRGECGICDNTCGDWYKIIIPNPTEDLGYITKNGIVVSDKMAREVMVPKEKFGVDENNHFLERGITIIDVSRQKLDGHHSDNTELFNSVGNEEDNNYQDSLSCTKNEFEAFRNLKKETITRDAANHWVFKINGGKWSNNDDTAGDNYASFRAGAKWQEELNKKLYSEEELNKILETILSKKYDNGEMFDVVSSYDIKKVFEQLKK